jgi:hypothetical protein
MGSIVRIRIRVPAGTVILFLSCAATPALEFAPVFGVITAIPASSVAVKTNLFRIFFFSFSWNLHALPGDGQ